LKEKESGVDSLFIIERFESGTFYFDFVTVSEAACICTWTAMPQSLGACISKSSPFTIGCRKSQKRHHAVFVWFSIGQGFIRVYYMTLKVAKAGNNYRLRPAKRVTPLVLATLFQIVDFFLFSKGECYGPRFGKRFDLNIIAEFSPSSKLICKLSERISDMKFVLPPSNPPFMIFR
jgi:hypothetical protein